MRSGANTFAATRRTHPALVERLRAQARRLPAYAKRVPLDERVGSPKAEAAAKQAFAPIVDAIAALNATSEALRASSRFVEHVREQAAAARARRRHEGRAHSRPMVRTRERRDGRSRHVARTTSGDDPGPSGESDSDDPEPALARAFRR